MIFNKKYFSLIFVVLATTSVAAEFFTPGCDTFGVSCLDCYTQKLCIGGSIWSNTSCQGSPNNPNIYCNPKTYQCTSTPPPECSPKRGIKCLRPNGIFPDINNCSRFTKCEDDAPKTFECPPMHIYNQTLGKCIIQLENSNCFQVTCGMLSNVNVYPGDASLYYQCGGGLGKLQACDENSVYNLSTRTCQGVCKGEGKLPNLKNCSEYINCNENGTPSKLTCPSGFGFNPILRICQKGLNKLCFEIATLNQTLNGNLYFLPGFVKFIFVQVKNILETFNIDYSILFNLGVPAKIISAGLLIADYSLKHRLMLPPVVLNKIVEFILFLLPPNLKIGANLIVSIILGKSLF